MLTEKTTNLHFSLMVPGNAYCSNPYRLLYPETLIAATPLARRSDPRLLGFFMRAMVIRTGRSLKITTIRGWRRPPTSLSPQPLAL